MKTLASVAGYGLVPFPVQSEGHACPDNDDHLPTTEDANAALLAWYRHLVAERMANDRAVDEAASLPLVNLDRTRCGRGADGDFCDR
jgi:hypothetical protein